MSVARKILSNTFIQTAGKLATAVLSVIVIKYITSLEIAPAFKNVSADYKLIYAYLAFFGIIADFGLFTIAVREFSKDERKPSFVLGNIFGMRMISIALAMVLAVGIVFLIQDSNYSLAVKVGVAIAAVTTAFTMLASTTTSVLQERLKMTFPTIALTLGKIIMTGYIIWVVLNYATLPYAFYQLLFAGVVGNGFVLIITYLYTYRVVPFRPLFNFSYWKEIFFKALPYGIAIILSTLYLRIDILILSFFRDKSEIALYGYPASIIELITIVPIYFMNCVLPVLTRSVREDPEKFRRVVRHSLDFLVLCSVPIMIGGAVLARPFVLLIMNETFLSDPAAGFYGADLAFQLILFTLPFAFVSHLFGYILVALDKQKRLLFINLAVVVFNLVINFIFIPRFGFRAAGVCTILSHLLVLVLTFVECRKHVLFHVSVSTTLRTLLAGAAMGVCVYVISGWNIFIVTAVGAVLFGAFAWLLRVVTPATLRELRVIR